MTRSCLGVLALLVVSTAARSTAQDPSACGAVSWEGDAALVEAVEQRVGSCEGRPLRTITITASDGRVRIVLQGTEGAAEVRDAGDVATAALLIASWLEADRVDLLEPEEASQLIVPAPPAASAPIAAQAAASTPTTSPRASLVTVHASGAAAFGNESSSWFGVHVGACIHAGPACIGGSARYLGDSNLSDGTPPERGQRTLLGGDIDVAVPMALGQVITLVPTLAVGLAWLDSVVFDGPRSVSIAGLRVLVSAGLSLAMALLDWLALDVQVGLSWSPLARQADYTTDGAHIDPDPVVFGTTMLGLRAEIR